MDIKPTAIPTTTVTRDLSKISAITGNIYESTMVIAKRSNQIAAETKQDLNRKLEEFSSFADSLEETFENREQIEISRYYERMPKSSLTAVQEFLDGKIYYRLIEEKKDK